MDQFEGEILLPVPRNEAIYVEGHPISGFYQARQIVNGHERTVMIRKYKQCATAEHYFAFLKSQNHYNMFDTNYKLYDNGEAFLAFTNTVTCTLKSYLSVLNEECNVTPGRNKFQRDFTDSLVSILRQILDVIEYLHENNIYIGDMTLESIFLDCERPTPRVLILPPLHEASAKLGENLPFSVDVDLHMAQDDWLRFGGLLTSICASLNVNNMDEALEIYDLSDKLCKKKFNSMDTIRLHPALLFEYRKSAFVVEFYEAVIPQPGYIRKFSYKPQALKDQSWKIRFQHLIDQLSEPKRMKIGKQPDSLYNFIKFVRNTIGRSNGQENTRNNFGDPPTALRYFRDYYKLIDLIPKATGYVEAAAAIQRLIQD